MLRCVWITNIGEMSEVGDSGHNSSKSVWVATSFRCNCNRTHRAGSSDKRCYRASRTRKGGGHQAPSRNVSFLAYEVKGISFAASPFRSHDNGPINFSVLLVKGLISMKLSEPSKCQRLLTIPAKLPMLTAPKKEEGVFEMSDATASMTLWKRRSEGLRC